MLISASEVPVSERPRTEGHEEVPPEESEAEGVTVGVVPTKVAGKVSPTSLEK
ncbi:hypothetical protein [Citrobacter freundii]|uniref:hypothetical protein n=1 Tax=Citrobacter freundii TaxID=546 RepID=UPI0015F0DC97|nr:hypothetical protein [Citrobacter freundii]